MQHQNGPRLTNNELNSLALSDTMAVTQDISNMNVLSKLLAALGLPVNERPVVRREVSLGKDVVGKMSKMLKLDALVQADALGRDLGGRTVHVVISEP